MSLASTFKSVSRKHFTNVSHVNGFRPFPRIHSSKMASLISFALYIFALSMPEVIAPLSSLSRNVPNFLYFVPICSAMLMLPRLLGNFSRSGRLGLLSVAEFKCRHVHNEDNLNYYMQLKTSFISHILHNYLHNHPSSHTYYTTIWSQILVPFLHPK